jgi:tetratricopeptide (TPR) repeat protein
LVFPQYWRLRYTIGTTILAWYNRGTTLNDWGYHSKAIKSFDRILTIQPDYCKAWLNRGVAWEKLQSYEDAIANYNRAAQLKPEDYTIWYKQSSLLCLTG